MGPLKMLAKSGSLIVFPKESLEGMMHGLLLDLTTTLIPLFSYQADIAIKTNASPNTPPHMSAFALYFTINNQRNAVIGIMRELAKEEQKYRELMPILGEGDAESTGFSPGSLQGIDVKLRQWRRNIQNFYRRFDPDWDLWKVRHVFDDDPPSFP